MEMIKKHTSKSNGEENKGLFHSEKTEQKKGV